MEKERMGFSAVQNSQNRIDPHPSKSRPKWVSLIATRGSRSQQKRARVQRSSESGFGTIGYAFTVIIFTLGFGIIYLLGEFGNRIQKQIEMDQHTGRIALELRATLLTIEGSQARVRNAEIALAGSCIFVPGACLQLKDLYDKYLFIEEQFQKAARIHWKTKTKDWYLYQPFLSIKSPLPDLDTTLNQGDAKLNIRFAGLTSTARVWHNKKGIKPHVWKVAWTE